MIFFRKYLLANLEDNIYFQHHYGIEISAEYYMNKGSFLYDKTAKTIKIKKQGLYLVSCALYGASNNAGSALIELSMNNKVFGVSHGYGSRATICGLIYCNINDIIKITTNPALPLQISISFCLLKN